MDLRQTSWSGLDWIDLAQVRNRWGTLVNLNIPYGSLSP
jgi:hypothetical protein